VRMCRHLGELGTEHSRLQSEEEESHLHISAGCDVSAGL
jgi:hypothetical protein